MSKVQMFTGWTVLSDEIPGSYRDCLTVRYREINGQTVYQKKVTRPFFFDTETLEDAIEILQDKGARLHDAEVSMWAEVDDHRDAQCVATVEGWEPLTDERVINYITKYTDDEESARKERELEQARLQMSTLFKRYPELKEEL